MYWLIDRLPKRKLEMHDRELDFYGVKCKVQTFDPKDLYNVVMYAGDGAVIMLDRNISIIVRKVSNDEDRITE
jgi:hypothetical protein